MTVTHPLDDRAGAPDAWVVHLPPELDLATVDDLAPAVAEAIRVAVGAVTFDCSSLVFIDAVGIGALVGAANDAAEAGLVVRLLHPCTMLCRLILLTDVGRRFVFEPA